MSKKFSRNPIKGMDDYFPSDMRVFNYINKKLRNIAELYCYEEYDAPILEAIEIFEAKTSDELVNEQSFIVEKKEGERLILRPEITPQLARMVAKISQEKKKPIRWYSNPRLYRYEQPQRGRKREFYQFNVDILGEDTLYAELEILQIVVDFLTDFGATSDQFQIYFNNRRFVDAICEILLEVPKQKISQIYSILDKADKMEESEFEKYLIDSFESESIIQGIKKLKDADDLDELLANFDDIPSEFYDSKGYQELRKLTRLIESSEISEYCSFSSGVVRGLDYYTGTVFEVYDMGDENIRAIFGGGRYDDLLSIFSDEEMSGIGFGMGLLMLELFLRTYNLLPEDLEEPDYSKIIYIATLDEEVAPYVFKISNILRDQNIPCIIDYRFENLGNQLSKANDLGVMITLIIGPKEMKERRITIKNMVSEEQKTIETEELVQEIIQTLSKLS
ncbi:MAG: histidine--tRNA ligase [Promethearchaeati archaeon]